jgi:hypothetical protein
MQTMELSPDRLLLYYHRQVAFRWLMVGCFSFGGIFFAAIGFLLIWQGENAGIIAAGMGLVFTIAALFILRQLPQVDIFTFDRHNECLFCERKTSLESLVSESLTIPFRAIVAVEVVDDNFSETTCYRVNLILDGAYWRICLNSSDKRIAAETIGKNISEFLEIDYFCDGSKAPLSFWQTKSLATAPCQFSWQYFAKEVDRLQRELDRSPLDAERYQEMGLLLCDKPQESKIYLQKAQTLFTTAGEVDRALLAKVFQEIVLWQSNA